MESTCILHLLHGQVSKATWYPAITVGVGQVQKRKCSWQSKKLRVSTNLLENSVVLQHWILKPLMCVSLIFLSSHALSGCVVAMVWWPCYLLGRGKLSRESKSRKKQAWEFTRQSLLSLHRRHLSASILPRSSPMLPNCPIFSFILFLIRVAVITLETHIETSNCTLKIYALFYMLIVP